MPVDPSLLDRDIEVIRKRHGDDAVHLASEQIPIERIPIDSPTLMRITSVVDTHGNVSAGIPIGRVTRIYGDPSTGKTMLAYLIILAAQKYRSKRFPNGLKCCYWNIEQQFDVVYAEKLGIDLNALALMEHRIIEDIGATMEHLMGSIHLHVLDSASFATSIREIVGPNDSKRPEYDVYSLRGAHAAAWKFAINRIHNRMDKDANVLIVIDHTGRDQQTQAERPLSGRRMEFRSDLSIHLRRGPWLFYNKNGRLDVYDKVKDESGMDPRGQKESDGVEVAVKIAKSRVCRPLRLGKMRLDLNTMRFDQVFELADFGIYYDESGELAHRSKNPPIIGKSGAWYSLPGYEKPVQGFDNLCLKIADDPMLQRTIRQIMLKG